MATRPAKKLVTVPVDPRILARLDEAAHNLGLNRAEYLRGAILLGHGELERTDDPHFWCALAARGGDPD